MDYAIFEARIRSIIPTENFYPNAHLLSTILPEKRELFVLAVTHGFSLVDTIRLYYNGDLTPEIVQTVQKQKLQDNSSEIQA